MGEHSVLVPHGRVVSCEMCSEYYEIPEGQSSIYSTDDLAELAYTSEENLPYIDADREYVDLNRIQSFVDKGANVIVGFICPNPHDGDNREGSYCYGEAEDFNFDAAWKCTDCGDMHEDEQDAENCCTWKRARVVELAKRSNLSIDTRVSQAKAAIGKLTADELEELLAQIRPPWQEPRLPL